MTLKRLFLIAVLFVGLGVPIFAQTANVMPAPKFTAYDSNGDPCSGCLLYTYQAGSTTPQDTCNSSSLASSTACSPGTTNANPVVLDSAGRVSVFLLPATYRFDLKTSAGVAIWSVDNVTAIALATDLATLSTTVTNMGNAALTDFSDGRCTLTTATPVTTSDVTAATTVFYTPYNGSYITLRSSGGTWQTVSFTEKSISLGADAANTNYDVFGFSSGGTLSIERLAWSSDTARATALAQQNGVLVKSGDPTRRYLCTYRTTAAVGQTEDSLAKRFVWNYAHRVPRAMKVIDSTDTWNYTTDAFRQANNSTANQLAFVVGVLEVPVMAQVASTAANSTGGVSMVAAIGMDTTATATGLWQSAEGAANARQAITATFHGFTTAVGFHFLAWLERSVATGTTTWSGDGGGTRIQSGISGWIEG